MSAASTGQRPGQRFTPLTHVYGAMQILQVGPDNLEHPLNKKVRCQVYLRDLQEEAGLTDAALQHIARVCGPRRAPALRICATLPSCLGSTEDCCCCMNLALWALPRMVQGKHQDCYLRIA